MWTFCSSAICIKICFVLPLALNERTALCITMMDRLIISPLSVETSLADEHAKSLLHSHRPLVLMQAILFGIFGPKIVSFNQIGVELLP
jgi:hypothetical protein